MLLYPAVGSSNIDLQTAAGDSVHSARCFGVSLVLCGIQVFLNFLDRFSQIPSDAVSNSMDLWKESTIGISLLVIGLFLARMQGSRYLFFRIAVFLESFMEVFHF